MFFSQCATPKNRLDVYKRQPQSVSYGSLISLKHIREGVFLRSTVEPAIYRQIAGSAPVEFLKEMKKTIQETEDLLYSDKGISIDQFIHLDDHLPYLCLLYTSGMSSSSASWSNPIFPSTQQAAFKVPGS